MNKVVLKKNIIAVVLIISIIIGLVVSHNVTVNKGVNKTKANGNEVIEFEYSSAALDNETIHLVNKSVYKTEFFANPSTYYNHELAKLSQAISLASGSTAESIVNWGKNFNSVINTSCDLSKIDYKTNRNAYIVEVYKKLGFYNDVYKKYDVSLNDTSDTGAYSIAMKKIQVNNKKYTLVCATPRSVTYGSEWASNFHLYDENGKTGFENAGEDFYQGIKNYIKKNRLGKNTKVWISGYSRGAGIANVAAALLDRDIANGQYKFNKEDVYAYMCATPRSTLDKECGLDIYNNIFNIVIESDIVSTVAPSCWNYERYGNVAVIPHKYLTASEFARIQKGKKVNKSDEEVKLIKDVCYKYNVIRYENALNDEIDDVNKLFPGLKVGPGISNLMNVVGTIIGDTVQDYADVKQGIFTDLTPFLINQFRKYDEKTGTWVRYDTLAEYISVQYGNDVINKAVEAGVFSQTEYNEKIERGYALLNRGILDQDNFMTYQKLIDGYYGLRILALHNGVEAEHILEFGKRGVERIDQLVAALAPLPAAFDCKKNHFGEFYLAWLDYYNPYTRKIIQ